MDTEIAFETLNSCVGEGELFRECFRVRVSKACEKYPRSVCAFLESELGSGEITVYIIPGESYCEYEFLNHKNERFRSDREQFETKKELKRIVRKFSENITSEIA